MDRLKIEIVQDMLGFIFVLFFFLDVSFFALYCRNESASSGENKGCLKKM